MTEPEPSTSAPVAAEALARPVRSTSWFQAHQSEMMQKIATCNDNPGGARTDPECVNADEVKRKIDYDAYIAEQRRLLGQGPPK
jgi:hypothetical protein